MNLTGARKTKLMREEAESRENVVLQSITNNIQHTRSVSVGLYVLINYCAYILISGSRQFKD
ncbi:hypothetical protein BGX23_001802, partial [Mortierella sp. AD031]